MILSVVFIALIAFLGWFSVKKFKRVKVDKIYYSILKKELDKIEGGSIKDLLADLNADKAFVEGKAGAVPLNHHLDR